MMNPEPTKKSAILFTVTALSTAIGIVLLRASSVLRELMNLGSCIRTVGYAAMVVAFACCMVLFFVDKRFFCAKNNKRMFHQLPLYARISLYVCWCSFVFSSITGILLFHYWNP